MPARASIKRYRLDRPERVRRELAAVYGECRAGRMPFSDGTRAAHILQSILRAIEGHDLEVRIAQLEQSAAGGL